MSMELELELNEKRIKPVFNSITKFNKKISCLLDTGASMPVWCKSEGLFNVLFPDAKKVTGKYILSGFGKGYDIIEVYKIPEFYISNGTDKIVFKDLLIAMSYNRDFGCDLILSYTMFNKMDYLVLNRDVINPILRFIYDRDTYYITPVLEKIKSNDVYKRISVFSAKDEEIKDVAAGFRNIYKDKYTTESQ